MIGCQRLDLGCNALVDVQIAPVGAHVVQVVVEVVDGVEGLGGQEAGAHVVALGVHL